MSNENHSEGNRGQKKIKASGKEGKSFCGKMVKLVSDQD